MSTEESTAQSAQPVCIVQSLGNDIVAAHSEYRHPAVLMGSHLFPDEIHRMKQYVYETNVFTRIVIGPQYPQIFEEGTKCWLLINPRMKVTVEAAKPDIEGKLLEI